MKILVTGAKGFVGKNLCAQLNNIKEGKARCYGDVTVDAVYEYDDAHGDGIDVHHKLRIDEDNQSRDRLKRIYEQAGDAFLVYLKPSKFLMTNKRGHDGSHAYAWGCCHCI